MRLALACSEGNFVGREYLDRMTRSGVRPDKVILIGRFPTKSRDLEVERTGGLWNPPAIPASVQVERFESSTDPRLADMIVGNGIDLVVQGGVGILSGPVIEAPSLGWINVHPGALPAYRGSSCPEWALLAGDPVVATAHLIDGGIDTGPVVCAETYPVMPDWTYEMFRANLYAHCANVLVRAIGLLRADGRSAATPQLADGAKYHSRISATILDQLRRSMPARGASDRSAP